MNRKRILIAERRSRVRFALRTLLQQHEELEIVGESTNAESVLAQVQTRCPDLLLLDWDLPGIATTNLVTTVHALCPSLPVVVLSGRLDQRQAALEAGASGFLSKTEPPERLLEAIGG